MTFMPHDVYHRININISINANVRAYLARSSQIHATLVQNQAHAIPFIVYPRIASILHWMTNRKISGGTHLSKRSIQQHDVYTKYIVKPSQQ